MQEFSGMRNAQWIIWFEFLCSLCVDPKGLEIMRLDGGSTEAIRSPPPPPGRSSNHFHRFSFYRFRRELLQILPFSLSVFACTCECIPPAPPHPQITRAQFILFFSKIDFLFSLNYLCKLLCLCFSFKRKKTRKIQCKNWRKMTAWRFWLI